MWLTMLSGWPMLFFCGLSCMVVFAGIAVPYRFGSRAWGVGEAGMLVGLGILPVLGSFYAQSQMLTWLAFLVSIPCSLLVTLVLFDYNAVNYRRDWLIHKRTLAVNLGLTRSRDFGAVLTILAYVSILLIVSLTDLPLLALVGLAPLPVALGVFARLQRESLTSADFIDLYRTAINVSVWTGLLFAVALVTDKNI
jgi:1,4-dihydroxy-2-naphthoate octaprenyltransferase